MNTYTKSRLVTAPIALACMGVLVAACDQLGTNPADTLCCREFTPGADLSGVTWGLEGAEEVRFAALIQAAADFSGAASSIVNDVSSACEQLALDLGAATPEPLAADPAKRAEAWCALAAAQLKSQVNGKVTFNYQPPSCDVSVKAQADCEAHCNVTAECKAKLGDIKARCAPGAISGRCDAKCTGKCEGSANLAVTCDGVCHGACEGKCDAKPSSGMCAGACSGRCRGTCEVQQSAMVTCEGECTGGCTGELKAPTCKAELTPPEASCNADADCAASCQASASARAECSPPALEAFGAIDPQIIASLKLTLPDLIAVADARGKVLAASAQKLLDVSAKLDAGKLNVKAGACLIPATAALKAASTNAQAGFEGSGKVILAAGIRPY
jgi:hypothetical protein